MRPWKPRRMLPRASRSLASDSAFCHVDCVRGERELWRKREGGEWAHQHLVVPLLEACQTLLRIVGLGLLPGRRVTAEETFPLRLLLAGPFCRRCRYGASRTKSMLSVGLRTPHRDQTQTSVCACCCSRGDVDGRAYHAETHGVSATG